MTTQINISLDKKAREEVAKVISVTLADTYVLYTKTQNFHWNVIDPRFYPLHKFWQEQYEELAEANDIIAERIRMLGEVTPGTLKQFLKLTTLKEVEGVPSGDEMLRDLLKDHEQMIKNIRKGIDRSTELGDQGTADMLIQRLRSHEKAAWMLRSHFVK